MANLIKDLENGRILLTDGAMATELFKKGLAPGEEIVLAHVNHTNIITHLAKEYIEAGSDISLANSHFTSSISLKRYNRDKDAYDLTYKAAMLNKEISGVNYVAGVIAPTTGEFKEWAMDPTDAYSEDDFYESYKEQTLALKDADVDLVICLTFSVYQELRAALRASKEREMTTVACLAFDYIENSDDFRTSYGASIDNLTSLNDADIVGFSCGTFTLDQAVKLTERLRERTDKPLFAKPNGGVPGEQQKVYPPEVFAEYGEKIIEAGATFIGGCCGTGPDHAKELKKVVDKHNA
jgi:5-methyltetrahydrofolate--homocysteine methyltransferase